MPRQAVSFCITVREIATALGGVLVCGEGNGSVQAHHPIDQIAALDTASNTAISFLGSGRDRYLQWLATTQAACVILSPEVAQTLNDKACRFARIITADPYLYYARLTQWWRSAQEARQEGVRPQRCIHPTAVIGRRVVLGEGVSVGPLSVLEDDVVIGANTRIAARVTVGARCRMGAHGIVHSGVVIGADGFGFARDQALGEWVKIEQLGAVRIGNHVEIGANTCIDRGALSDTVIEDGVKLDNLIQIGHNVHIGRCTALAGCVGVAGSAKIGQHCTIGGGAVILGHLALADHVHISAASVVTRSILKAGTYSGIFPIDENAQWEKNAVTLRQLSALRDRLRRLEKGLSS